MVVIIQGDCLAEVETHIDIKSIVIYLMMYDMIAPFLFVYPSFSNITGQLVRDVRRLIFMTICSMYVSEESNKF